MHVWQALLRISGAHALVATDDAHWNWGSGHFDVQRPCMAAELRAQADFIGGLS